MNIRVKATDVAGAYTSTAFKINIKESSAIPRKQDPVIRIFPNPSSGQVNVTVEGSRGKTMMVEVADYGGRTILTKRFSDRVILDLTGRPAGIYILKILLDSEVTSHKICIE